MAEAKGYSIFLDIFRRADSNDDGHISWDEFKGYFHDGVLSNGDLKTLFQEIDTHNTDNIDTEELCTYFSHHLGAFGDVFCVLEDMHKTTNTALIETAEKYSSADMKEQFVVRLLMKEIFGQLSALKKSLYSACEQVEEQTIRHSGNEIEEPQFNTVTSDLPSPADIVPGRYARRAAKQLNLSMPNYLPEGSVNTLTGQIQRLQLLVDKLENKIKFDQIPDEQLNIKKEKLIYMIYRQFDVKEGTFEKFCSCLKNYVNEINKAPGSRNITVRSYEGKNTYVMYEFWEEEDLWSDFSASEAMTQFQHHIEAFLESEMVVNYMPVPASWWSN